MAHKRVDTLQKAHDYAKRHELESGGCAQCCLAGIFEALGVENDEGVFMAATGLADGVGLTGDGHCGALSGGVMAIGYFFGRSKKDFGNMKKQLKACILAKSLHDAFAEKYGTCRCADLQEKLAGRFFNLYDPEEMEAALEAGMPEKCSDVVGETAQMAAHIILAEKDREAEKSKD
ncbi:MAG: C_GCAxxG_C_C family protein [Desulfobacterales bacterium]|nr:C_GCAxxG_C_C family protein [Desulfobacterales bacterium]